MGHLLCGLIVGWLAAAVSFWMGLSVGSMLGVYALGASLGLVFSVLSKRGMRGEAHSIAQRPALGDEARQGL
jgi:H+/Cl- antiporter ClcA